MSVIVKLLSKFDDSGINKAKKSFGGLKTALGAVGIGFGLKAITDGLLDAAKAASADQKSMQLLNNQLRRNANATDAQVKANDKFIDSLSNQVGIVDDELRPAMGQLVRATGDTKKAQDLLKLALDASATTGKPLALTARALSQAFAGNRTQLNRLFPTLKESKDLFGDLAKIVGGAAVEQADPFSKFNVAMDNLKEKLGTVILPYLVDFIDTMMMPGGAIDQVSKFLDDVSNPKTEAGKTFIQIKDAVAQTIDGVKEFFALFGDGDAVKGIGNVASNLVKALPALLALKGIMTLASAGKSIANLAKAIGLMTGAKGVTGGVPGVAGAAGGAVLMNVASVAITSQAATLTAASIAQEGINKQLGKTGQTSLLTAATFTGTQAIPFTRSSDLREALFGMKRQPTTVVNLNVQNADPKATVDAVSKYVKQNGGLPGAWGTVRP